MDANDIRELMHELCAVDLDMEGGQLQELHRACTIIEEITASQCRHVVSTAGSRPCLQVFMSDGWSPDVRS